MKTLPLIATLLLATVTIAPGARAAEAASLTVTFKGLTARSGSILFTVVNSEDAYNDKARAVTQAILPANADTVSQTFTGLAPGRYAIKAFHDVNGDGKMGMNPFGMPTEPFAFSNKAVASMGPPNWEAAAFELKAGENIRSIDID